MITYVVGKEEEVQPLLEEVVLLEGRQSLLYDDCPSPMYIYILFFTLFNETK